MALASASFFMSYFSRLAWGVVSAYSSLRPTVVDDSIVFSLFFAGYVAVQVPSGALSDRADPRLVLSPSLLGLALSSLASGLADSMSVEYAASFFMGLSAGWIYPATVKLISSEFSRGELPTAMGYYSLAWPLSIVIAGVALPALCIDLGWRAPYYLIAAVSAALSASYLPLRRSARPRPRNAAEFGLAVLKDVNALTVSAAGFLFFLSYWAVALYAYKYFLEAGLGGYEAGFAYSLLALAGIPSTVVAGAVMDRLGVKKTLVAFEAAYGLLIALLGAVRGALLFLNAALMGFVRFVITPANSTAVSLVGRDKAGTVAGVANLFWQSSGIVAPAVAAYVLPSGGYEGLWLLSGLLAAASAIMYLALLKI